MVSGDMFIQAILFICLCSSLMAFLLSQSMRKMALHFWLSLTLIAGLFFSANQVLIGTSCLFIAIFSYCLYLFYGLATVEKPTESDPKDRIKTGFYAFTSICLSTIVAFAFDSGRARPHSATIDSPGAALMVQDVAEVLMNRQFFSVFLVLIVGLSLVLCWSEILGLEQKFEPREEREKP